MFKYEYISIGTIYPCLKQWKQLFVLHRPLQTTTMYLQEIGIEVWTI